MTTYYLCSPIGLPHRFDPLRPDLTKCGRTLTDARPVDELQVIVYFGGETCVDCTRPKQPRAKRKAAST